MDCSRFAVVVLGWWPGRYRQIPELPGDIDVKRGVDLGFRLGLCVRGLYPRCADLGPRFQNGDGRIALC